MKHIKYVLILLCGILLFSCAASEPTVSESTVTEDEVIETPEAPPISVIHIDTSTGEDVVSKEEYILTSFKLESTDGKTVSFTDAKIRGRGNQSWKLDKKPYRLKLPEAAALLSGSDSTNKDWILLACHSDKSFLRDDIAFSLGRGLDGIEWSPLSEHVEVYLNGEYRGIYLLTERIEASSDRIDIEEGIGDSIGFLFELDGYAEGEQYTDYFEVAGDRYSLHSDFSSPEQIQELEKHLSEAYRKTLIGSYETASEYLDIDSAVDSYILYEYMANQDAGFSSFYMYVKEPGGIVFFGPPWDFDASSGNTRNSVSSKGMYIGKGDAYNSKISPANPWFAALTHHDWFNALVKERWNSIKDTIKATVEERCTYAKNNSALIERNFEVWNILNKRINVEPDAIVRLGSYSENVDYLKNWLDTRWSWLDVYFNSDDFVS